MSFLFIYLQDLAYIASLFGNFVNYYRGINSYLTI